MLTAQLADPLGGIIDDVTSILQKGERYLDIIKDVLEDPALPTVANQVRTLRSLTKAKASTAAAKVTSTSAASQINAMSAAMAAGQKGVGLAVAVKPLDMYIWTQQHKAATWAILAGVVLVPVGLGVLAGRATKRCGAARRR